MTIFFFFQTLEILTGRQTFISFPADCMGEILTLESGNEVAMETGNSDVTHKHFRR